MIKKITTYAIYGTRTGENNISEGFASEGTVSPRVVSSRDIEKWEMQLNQNNNGLRHKITQFFPIKKKYIIIGLKELFKRKK